MFKVGVPSFMHIPLMSLKRTSRWVLAFCLGWCGVLIGISSSAQATLSGTIVHDGLVREYILYVPASYQAGIPVPLVFNLHGYTSDNTQQFLYADFRPIADTANFIIVLPNGTIDPVGNRYWDTFGLGLVDDLGFITDLLDSISANYSIDPERVYSTGMSNGGFMSYDLACFRSERFAAIASVTGTMLDSRLISCNAVHPTPVMQIHGTADPTVNFLGGSGLVAIEDLVTHWVDFNNCNPTPEYTQLPDINTTDGCTAEHFVYLNGDLGSTVEFLKVIGGGHTWPGSPFVIGVTNQDFNACKEIWRFFSQYTLTVDAGIGSTANAEALFTVGPNPTMDDFLIRFNGHEKRTITLWDIAGKLVFTSTSTDSSVALRTEPGIYLVQVREGEKVATEKVVHY